MMLLSLLVGAAEVERVVSGPRASFQLGLGLAWPWIVVWILIPGVKHLDSLRTFLHVCPEKSLPNWKEQLINALPWH